jgi:type II secretory pathway component GspD/PulD (secretin)
MRSFLLTVIVTASISCELQLFAGNISTNPSPAAEFVQEIVQIKYSRAADIAALFNNLSTPPLSQFAHNGETREIISNAWLRLSPTFKEMNDQRGNSSPIRDPGERFVSGYDSLIASERTNSLLLRGTAEDVRILKEAINKLDLPLAQVLIEGVILEVTLPDSPGASGLNWLHDWMQSRRGISAQPTGPDPNTRTINFIALNQTNPAPISSKSFSQVVNFGADLDEVIRDLAEGNRVKILQRPRIQTSVSEPAVFFVGESRPAAYPTGSYTCGGSYSSIQQLQLGVTIEVTVGPPNPDKSLQMKIHLTSEQANGTVQIHNVGSVPITSRREFEAELTIPDRKTIVLGGMSNAGGKGERQHILVMLRPTLLSPEPNLAASARKP